MSTDHGDITLGERYNDGAACCSAVRQSLPCLGHHSIVCCSHQHYLHSHNHALTPSCIHTIMHAAQASHRAPRNCLYRCGNMHQCLCAFSTALRLGATDQAQDHSLQGFSKATGYWRAGGYQVSNGSTASSHCTEGSMPGGVKKSEGLLAVRHLHLKGTNMLQSRQARGQCIC